MMQYKRDKYGNSELCLNIMLGDNSFWDRKNPESDGLMTGDEYDAYIEAIREALTDGGNICDVDAQENLISIDGNAGGNLDRFREILDELYSRGCWLECDICVDEDGNCEQYATSLEAHLEELRERAKDF